MDWKEVDEGPKWLPVLNQTEVTYDIPTDLLARVAYQESHFRPDIISGSTRSPAGAVGIMQLIPKWFPGAGVDPVKDIGMAGTELARLWRVFGDWQVSLAAYNWGQGNVDHEYAREADRYVLGDLPQETQNYVTQIMADVPVLGKLIAV